MQERKPPRSKRSHPITNIQVIDTEGVDYILDWDKFPLNGFVFIRCLETERIMKELKWHSEKLGIKTSLRVGERNGYWGVGIWRRK
jgi:hypothetical protein